MEAAQHSWSPGCTTRFGSAQFSEASEAIAVLGGLARAQCLQTRPGRFAAEIRRVNLGNLELCFASISGSTVYQCTPHPGVDTIFLPLRWTGEMRWNGQVIDRPALLRYADYYTRAATDIDAVGIGFARGPIEDAAAALVGSRFSCTGCGWAADSCISVTGAGCRPW